MEHLAAQAVALAPADGNGWKALGIARLVQGKEAVTALAAARERMPRDVDLLAALGSALAGAHDLSAAADCYSQALALRPDLAHLHANLADVRLRQGEAHQAAQSARHALQLQPALLAGQLNLGRALLALRRADEAREVFEAVLRVQPGQVAAWQWLAQAWQGAGHKQRALDALHQAVRLRPASSEPLYLLGNLLRDMNLPTEAEAALRSALRHEPGHVQAANNLGALLMDQGRADEALPVLQQACGLQPGQARAHANRGNALLALGHFEDAEAALRQALDLDPDDVGCRRSLAHLLRSRGDASAARHELQQALHVAPDNLALGSEALFVTQYLVHDDAAQARVIADSRAWAAVAERHAAPRFTRWDNRPDPDRRLRVGLVSADLRAHPIAYFLASVLEAWQASTQVDVLAYANQHRADETTARLRASCRDWRTVVEMDDAALCAQIRSDAIDILVDLSGHTVGNRLPAFARKPAPVQVTWMGYFSTTGLESFDAVLADSWLVPPGDGAAFVEPVLRMPHSALCYTPPHPHEDRAPEAQSREGGMRFGCFNHLAKVGPDVVALWARVLQAVPGSTLLLKAPGLHDASVEARVRAAFVAHGLDADRLRVLPASDRQDHWQAHQWVDIMLDPFPYPGGTTTVESLWMGVPVLTMPGVTPLSRQGQSLLMNVGLPEWVARDPDDYLRKAAQHAANPQTLTELRGCLRQRLLASPLCNATQFAEDLQCALRTLWHRYCRNAGRAT